MKLRAYLAMTKSLQTALLLVTAVAGYASARCPLLTWKTLLAMIVSLFLVISGSTVLNMVYDRDIDAVMKRTCWRPLPVGQVTPGEALRLGVVLCVLGSVLAFAMSLLFGLVVIAGLCFDAVVYTLWLKRRTAWSIVIGGLAGGMPVLAGRTLALGRVDVIGLLLMLAVLLWIPTHIMTFSIRYAEDYRRAGVPTFPSRYGMPLTRVLISLASVGAAVSIMIAAVGIGLSWGYMGFLGVLGFGLLALAIANIMRPSPGLNFGLFKYASLYMLSSMLLVVAGTLW